MMQDEETSRGDGQPGSDGRPTAASNEVIRMAKYYDEFTDYSSLPYGDCNPPESEIVYAGYTYGDYTGNALIVFKRDGQWFENHDCHCSCYGLEEWSPEQTTPEAILMRPLESWPGLHDAVESALAADAVGLSVELPIASTRDTSSSVLSRSHLRQARDAMQRRAETAEADWNAAEVTIARLTEQRLQDIAIWERRIDEAGAERDAFRRNATLAVRRENEALQQRVARLTEALERLEG